MFGASEQMNKMQQYLCVKATEENIATRYGKSSTATTPTRYRGKSTNTNMLQDMRGKSTNANIAARHSWQGKGGKRCSKICVASQLGQTCHREMQVNYCRHCSKILVTSQVRQHLHQDVWGKSTEVNIAARYSLQSSQCKMLQNV